MTVTVYLVETVGEAVTEAVLVLSNLWRETNNRSAALFRDNRSGSPRASRWEHPGADLAGLDNPRRKGRTGLRGEADPH